ncbi:MAG TPA: metallophosphoesterase [Acidobacteriaceae bacterium]|nr:metallophosphoesterase [Acidobacteriaceae bacterium]
MGPTIESQQETEQRPSSSSQRPHRLTRRSFLTLSAATVGGLALYGGEIARHEISVEEHTIQLPRLPDAFRGMRIVQISDIHYLEFTESFFVREIVDHVNRLKPDMVLITGDFVTYGPIRLPHMEFHRTFALRHMPECASILNGIECPLRYTSLGNHDQMVNGRAIWHILVEHGLPCLYNTAIPLERDGQRLWLVGLGSACVGAANPEKAIPASAIREKEAMIVMAHEPDILPEIARYNADLMLSGHTHGGQIRIPFVPPLFLPEYGRRYVEGWFQYGATHLYVNRGIGAIGMPMRLNCPPEITVFTLA